MKKLIEWLGMSNRWKHLIGGLIIGIFAFGWFTAMYAGVLTAGALEYTGMNRRQCRMLPLLPQGAHNPSLRSG